MSQNKYKSRDKRGWSPRIATVAENVEHLSDIIKYVCFRNRWPVLERYVHIAFSCNVTRWITLKLSIKTSLPI